MTGMDRHGGCSEAPKGSAVTPPRVQPFVAKNKQTNKQKNQERETDVGEREVFERLVAPFMYLESSALNYELFLSRGRPVLHSQRTLGLFTWHGLFRGPQFSGGGNSAYSSTNLTFQEFVLPWDKNCKCGRRVC